MFPNIDFGWEINRLLCSFYSSDDVKSREFEKEKIQLDLKNADEKLAELVEGIYKYSFVFLFILNVNLHYL